MESNTICIDTFTISCHTVNTLIIGSGAAALNAALGLHRMGQDDICIATSQWGGGTSRNTGSDKQTYYKLSLCGSEPDSVAMMASDLFAGHCMHGDIALCEAQGSIQAFMNLVSLGVKFPHDSFGSWAGYKTDHDPRSRATSAGPYTSKMMFAALSGEVLKRNIRVFDKHHFIALLSGGGRKKVIGAVAVNTDEKDWKKAFVIFNSTNTVLGTGGPAGMYESSVYPISQEGSTGMAFKAGAAGQNLTEWQFGIASVKFRWNLSGSYQQVIPRYYSAEKDGSDEREFLNDHFPDFGRLLKAEFLKGYQWPFDPVKTFNWGSSLIDLLIHREITEKGREVFLDYTKNPQWKDGSPFDFSFLDPEAYRYLEKSRALKDTPIERLLAMNPAAIALYHDHGIDLASAPLKVAVCVQHNNGGLKGNMWWESNLKHLFPVGEVNGTHGVYRPGGSALNSGQVGSYRAAQFISRRYRDLPPPIKVFIKDAEKELRSILGTAESWMNNDVKSENNIILNDIRKRMSSAAAIVRNGKTVESAFAEAAMFLETIPQRLKASDVDELAESFRIADTCLSQYVYLAAIHEYIKMGGRSRGSYLVTTDRTYDTELCKYDREVEKGVLEIALEDNKVITSIVGVREIPVQDLWFENVWRDYLEDNWLGS